MAKKITLTAEPRNLLGRKIKQLRAQGILPANVFGKKITSSAVQVDLKTFQQVFAETGETTLVDLNVGKDTKPVLITNVQYNPVTGLPVHADFHQVDLTQTVTADIPVEIVGISPAVKEMGGVLETPLTEVEVEALPANLPENIEIDISNLVSFGDSISAADIKLSSDVKLLTDPETVLVIISEPREEEEPEPTPATEAETEAAEAETPAAESKESSDSGEAK